MQHGLIYKMISVGWGFSLFMVVATSVMADNNSSHTSRVPYTMQLIGNQSNPWALPQQQETATEYQPLPKYRGQQQETATEYQPLPKYRGQQQETATEYQPLPKYRGQQQVKPVDKQKRGFGFVTPEILESLKQQQTQNQLMPGNQQYQYTMPPQSTGSYYGSPQNVMRYPNNVYNVPAVTPWGGGSDVLYRGESLPMVPNEAIGGIAPIHVPSTGESSYLGNSNYDENKTDINVFNPFSFLRNENKK